MDPPFHLLICLIQSDDIGRNGGGMVFLVRREPSGKNAQNSSVFLQGCFNSRLIVKLHIYLIEASNSETTWLRCGSGTFLSDAGAAGVRKGRAAGRSERLQKGQGVPIAAAFGHFTTTTTLRKLSWMLPCNILHCWVFSLLPSFISLCIFMALGKEHRMRSQVLSLEASKQFISCQG